MINLLPPDAKRQIYYSKLNTIATRYMVLIVVIAICLSMIMVGGTLFAYREIRTLNQEIADKEQLVGDLRDIEKDAKEFEQELETVQKLFEQESQFSSFIQELAGVIPPWAKLNSLQLTRPEPAKTSVTINEEGEPVTTTIPSPNDGRTLDIAFSVRDASDAAVLRKNLLQLPRVEFVDIQNVVTTELNESTETTASMRLALKESPDKVYVPEEQN